MTAGPQPGPVAPGERIEALDVLRGFALLGILLLNIIGFGLPFVSYLNPAADGATQGVNFGVYVTVDVFFEGALRALFSMLFGAGVCLFAAGRGAGPYYRRQLLLLLFGLFDAFVLLWTGDILVPYAIAGLVLYFARNWRPRSLYIASGVVFTYLALLYALILVSLGMALTNYLMQSLICLFVFHEIGLGWWSELERYQLYFVVAAVWAFQVAVSLWWMGGYRFGPMEWLWRALTYGRLPPNALARR